MFALWPKKITQLLFRFVGGGRRESGTESIGSHYPNAAVNAPGRKCLAGSGTDLAYITAAVPEPVNIAETTTNENTNRHEFLRPENTLPFMCIRVHRVASPDWNNVEMNRPEHFPQTCRCGTATEELIANSIVAPNFDSRRAQTLRKRFPTAYELAMKL